MQTLVLVQLEIKPWKILLFPYFHKDQSHGDSVHEICTRQSNGTRALIETTNAARWHCLSANFSLALRSCDSLHTLVLRERRRENALVRSSVIKLDCS